MKKIIYDLYSRDLSKKGAFRKKNANEKRRTYSTLCDLRVHEQEREKTPCSRPISAEVVKRIFGYAASGVKARQIAICMNDEGIPVPTPNEYNRLNSTKKLHYVPMETVPLWTADIIRRILQDGRYIGNMVCGKYTSVKRKTIILPKSEWVITPNTHEAIVNEDVFRTAQAIFRTRKEIVIPAEPKSILTGILKCGFCKKSLAFESRYRRKFYCHNFNMRYDCEYAKADEAVLIDTIFAAAKVKLALIEASEQAYIADRQAKSRVP